MNVNSDHRENDRNCNLPDLEAEALATAVTLDDALKEGKPLVELVELADALATGVLDGVTVELEDGEPLVEELGREETEEDAEGGEHTRNA